MRWTTRTVTRQRYIPTPVFYGGQRIDGNYMTVKEAAKIFKVTTQAIRARIRRGSLDAIKIADMWYVPIGESYALAPEPRWHV